MPQGACARCSPWEAERPAGGQRKDPAAVGRSRKAREAGTTGDKRNS
ncbi:hypothetical protein STTU_5802 [Streptomyces sp. Tu6071]|nr:hypothetical protein STTU_5802 [Streptomyces sp. Tu6071]